MDEASIKGTREYRNREKTSLGERDERKQRTRIGDRWFQCPEGAHKTDPIMVSLEIRGCPALRKEKSRRKKKE
ncbi:hypothetical protein PV325_002667 [Microctonus aethiopoides]|nr:hypothetical protein PV325_002667 [Microctonus aethiopoides]